MNETNIEKNVKDYFERDKYTWRRTAEFFWKQERDPRVPQKNNK